MIIRQNNPINDSTREVLHDLLPVSDLHLPENKLSTEQRLIIVNNIPIKKNANNIMLFNIKYNTSLKPFNNQFFININH